MKSMKSNNRKVWAVVALLLCCLSAYADTALLVYLKGQTRHLAPILLADNPRITFNAGNMEISYIGGNLTLAVDNVDHWKFDDVTIYDDIDDALTDEQQEPQLRFTGQNTVSIDNVNDKSHVTVYSIDGKAQPFTPEPTPTGISINFGHLRQGTYIIRVEHQSFKILKQR